jgi:hypothetical protein
MKIKADEANAVSGVKLLSEPIFRFKARNWPVGQNGALVHKES